MVQRRLLTAGYFLRCPARCSRLTPHYHCPCHIWEHRHHNWSHQLWANDMFADESRFRLCHCDGRVRVLRHVGEKLQNCYIQETWKSQPLAHGMDASNAAGTSGLVVVDGMVKQQCYTERKEVLMQSMPRWLRAVMATRGGHIRYQLENRRSRSNIMSSESFCSSPTIVREIRMDNLKLYIYHIPSGVVQFHY